MKKKRLLFMLLAVVMLVSAFVGCGSRDDGGENGTTASGAASGATESVPQETTAAGPFDEHLDISMSFWGISDAFRNGNDDALLKLVQDKFNISLKDVSVTWSDYSEKYLLYAASGELPDVFAYDIIGNSTYHNWIKSEIIRSIPEDLSQYPNVEKMFRSADVQATRYSDGKYYMIPRQTYKSMDNWALDRSILVRKDWMANLGLKDPQNFEEFKAMLKAFVEQDPERNNKKDTIGMVINNMGSATTLFLGNFPELANESKAWVKQDSKWMPAYATDRAMEAVGQLKELYREGLLDKDFSIAKDGDAQNKFAEGKAGVFFFGNGYGYSKDIWDKINPDLKFADAVKYLRMWPAPDGKIYKFSDSTWWSESYFSAACDDKKMSRILALYDWLLSDEGAMTCRIGIKGKDWDEQDGQIVITRPKDDKGEFVNFNEYYPSNDVFKNMAAWQQDRMYEKNTVNYSLYGQDIVDMAVDELNWINQNEVKVEYNFNISFLSTPAKDALSGVNIKDEWVKMIVSDKPITETWKEMINILNENGLQQAIEEVTVRAAEMGY